ncbi:MFS transporter [Haloactinomyces albus]|uniref:MFS family permease n=1 Tax=Haloactinomyces albus TaxID=1352928 RepID=A0AAE4CPI9_9ACTN|nr:MFS transporter [Haloactinomyces albus]MDR7301738.1 MFS family permease [Haloactinomyces albus]
MTPSNRTHVPRVLTRVPLAGNYPTAVALALLALCPFIVLSTAVPVFERQLITALDTTAFGAGLAGSLANAGYAFGAVAAADLIRRLSPRAVYLLCEAGFVVGSLLSAFASSITMFTIGRALQGVTTGMLLVAALPPLVTNHGAAKLPLTAAFVNLGLFGMVTLGPVVGGLVAGFTTWRAPFVGVAALGVIGMTFGVLGFGRAKPHSRRAGFDWSAIPVAATATFLPFFAVAWLTSSSFTAPGFLLPLVVGLAGLGTLLVRQYRKDRALMPLKLLAHTLPITGVSVAMVAGAGFTTLIELSVVYLLQVAHLPPATAGALLAPQLAGIAIAAWLFKRMLSTRWLPVLAFSGLSIVTVGGVLLLFAVGSGGIVPMVPLAGLLLGFGAGAGVAPGLFMGGLSVPSTRLGPTFALVELLRAEAAFLLGPVLLHIAMLTEALAGGIRLATLILVILMAVSGVILLGVLLLGGARPHAPDLEGWLQGQSSAYHSPPLAATVRQR